MTTEPVAREVRSVDVELGAGRSKLRISLTKDEHGKPESLILSRGFGSGGEFYRPGYESLPLVIPPSALPKLIEALQSLEGRARAVGGS